MPTLEPVVPLICSEDPAPLATGGITRVSPLEGILAQAPPLTLASTEVKVLPAPKVTKAGAFMPDTLIRFEVITEEAGCPDTSVKLKGEGTLSIVRDAVLVFEPPLGTLVMEPEMTVPWTALPQASKVELDHLV